MSVAFSQNRWPVMSSTQNPGIYKWSIPVKQGEPRHYFLRRGAAGFILIHLLLWYHEKIEAINEGTWDEWGWAYRPIKGQAKGYSNHASGTAADVNATQHPLGISGTFKGWQYVKVRTRLLMYRGCIRWGGDYHRRKDEMHFEINKGYITVNRVAKRLAKTPRGKRILKANPRCGM